MKEKATACVGVSVSLGTASADGMRDGTKAITAAMKALGAGDRAPDRERDPFRALIAGTPGLAGSDPPTMLCAHFVAPRLERFNDSLR